VAASSNTYSFPAAVTILPSTTYYLYSNGLFGDFGAGSVSGGDTLAGSNAYFSGGIYGNGINFVVETPSFNFSLQGTAVVPEPAVFGLFSIGSIGVLVRRRRAEKE
jgi:hypothetical protein